MFAGYFWLIFLLVLVVVGGAGLWYRSLRNSRQRAVRESAPVDSRER